MESWKIQGSIAWKTMRKNHLMASEVPLIMGVSKYKRTKKQLWEEKLGLGQGQADNASMRYGRENEEIARKSYQSMTGNIVSPDVVFSKELPYLGASLDGISEDRTRVLEIKCTNKANHELAREGKIPEEFYPQLQQQMECAGVEYMDYFSFHKGEGIVVECKIDFDYLEIKNIKCKEFWDCVENLDEPDLEDEDYIERDDEWIDLASRLWSLKSERKSIESEEKNIEAQLKSLSQGKNSRGGKYRYKFSNRTGSIDYSSIPELKDLNLDIYRKKSTQSWSLKLDEDC